MTTSIHLSLSDYIVVVGYCAIVVGIGLWFRNRLSTVADYFAGGHQVPWWLAGISHYMSSFSAFSFIAYTQIAYLYGFTAITLFWASVPACVVGGLLLAKRWRRARVVTPVEFLQTRYSVQVQQICAWAGLPVKIFDDALKVFSTGVFLSVTCGMKLIPAVVLGGIVMVSYSFFGGLWALVVTDYVQFLMKSMAILLLLPLALHAAGGMTRGLEAISGSAWRPVGAPYTWIYIVGFFCLMMLSYNASWALAQKYYSVADEKAASKAAYLSAGLNFVGAPLMLMPGLLARQLMPELGATGRSADTYVLLLVKLLPEGMIGIILAAMLSATMATVSADFNAIASVLTQDVYRRFAKDGGSDRAMFRMGRVFTVALGALTTLLSIWVALSQRQSLFNLMVTVFGVALAPTLLPILAGLVSKRVNAAGALAGIVLGFLSGGVMLAIKLWCPRIVSSCGGAINFDGISLLVNVGSTALGLAAGSWLAHPNAKEQDRAAAFNERMQQPVLPATNVLALPSPMGNVLPWSTGGVAVLIGLAGLVSHSTAAHWIDGVAAIVFGVLSLLMMRNGRYSEENVQEDVR